MEAMTQIMAILNNQNNRIEGKEKLVALLLEVANDNDALVIAIKNLKAELKILSANNTKLVEKNKKEREDFQKEREKCQKEREKCQKEREECQEEREKFQKENDDLIIKQQYDLKEFQSKLDKVLLSVRSIKIEAAVMENVCN
eukprot:NODE_805_length_4084_cov_0.520703.p2 type:complete len:143 gc:universal NODE_805_length_4084_cov_0.520703:440-12(-)